MASSHPAWSHWSDATVLDDYAMTTTTTTASVNETIVKPRVAAAVGRKTFLKPRLAAKVDQFVHLPTSVDMQHFIQIHARVFE